MHRDAFDELALLINAPAARVRATLTADRRPKQSPVSPKGPFNAMRL